MPANTKLTPAIVLVTDRTLSGNYKVIFEAMLATMQTTQAPRLVMKGLLCPRVPAGRDGRASAASRAALSASRRVRRWSSSEVETALVS